MKTIVYPDVLVLQNFFMNYLLLYIVNRFCRCKAKAWRISLGAFVGSLYVFVIFFPDLQMLYSLTMKVMVSALMIVIAFSPYKLSRFLKIFILFYLEAFILGGCIIAIIYLSNYNLQFTNSIFITGNGEVRCFIIIGSIIGIILVKLGFDYFEAYFGGERNRVELKITTNKGSSCITALIDTGNSLRDPVNNSPVIIAYYRAVLNILPEEIKIPVLKGISYQETQRMLLNSTYRSRIRVIPYKALGTENGMLIGVRADRVTVTAQKRSITIEKPIIALYENPLSSNGEYEGLIYPEFIRGRYNYDKIS